MKDNSPAQKGADTNEKWGAQLKELYKMGLLNKRKNMIALQEVNGNVDKAVKILCNILQ